MGRISTPAFRIEYSAVVAVASDRAIGMTAGAWRSQQAGRPTDANLAKHVAHLEASTKVFGCNAHLGELRIGAARIVRQADGKVVAVYVALASGQVAA